MRFRVRSTLDVELPDVMFYNDYYDVGSPYRDGWLKPCPITSTMLNACCTTPNLVDRRRQSSIISNHQQASPTIIHRRQSSSIINLFSNSVESGVYGWVRQSGRLRLLWGPSERSLSDSYVFPNLVESCVGGWVRQSERLTHIPVYAHTDNHHNTDNVVMST